MRDTGLQVNIKIADACNTLGEGFMTGFITGWLLNYVAYHHCGALPYLYINVSPRQYFNELRIIVDYY